MTFRIWEVFARGLTALRDAVRVPPIVEIARSQFAAGGRCHSCGDDVAFSETECTGCWSERHV
ncbi:MAG: hypothetical protein EOO77_30525 [Oxalobacteraceae bacterium]|nr:MAG: hypothetical protein EOO77_30525 [Oxalobacteraceae bacterium]